MAAAAAAAAAAQWATIPGLPSLASAYENTAYLSSAAGLVQANNFRVSLLSFNLVLINCNHFVQRKLFSLSILDFNKSNVATVCSSVT